MEANLLDCPGYLIRAKATGTDVYAAGGAVNNCLNPFDIGLESPVAAPVGMGYLNPERNALAANIAFSHDLHLLHQPN